MSVGRPGVRNYKAIVMHRDRSRFKDGGNSNLGLLRDTSNEKNQHDSLNLI